MTTKYVAACHRSAPLFVALHSARPHVVSLCAIPNSTWCFHVPQVGVCEGLKHYSKWFRWSKCLLICLRAPYTEEMLFANLYGSCTGRCSASASLCARTPTWYVRGRSGWCQRCAKARCTGEQTQTLH